MRRPTSRATSRPPRCATSVAARHGAVALLATGCLSTPPYQPENAVSFTHNAAGVAAGHAAGIAVIGVGDEAQREVLLGFGAERVVPSVGVLLDRRLSDARGGRDG